MIGESIQQTHRQKQSKENSYILKKKSNYTVYLRDINIVFYRICSTLQKYCKDEKSIIQLWFNESFLDKLINAEDREYLILILEELVLVLLRTEQYSKFFIDRGPRYYFVVSDLNQLSNQKYQFQQEYYANPSFVGLTDKGNEFGLFLDAYEQIGIGENGRQSLEMMATFIQFYRLFLIEVIKIYNMKIDYKVVPYIYVNFQNINQLMLEDMNSLYQVVLGIMDCQKQLLIH
ncbi:unnamed protein product (macronuclear) [Paramecium tetraurelia]|uniref:Uncharacterized protein n=1 Tax=Paramecium tetraurelia TaxID=5888 RepID=A0CZX0_PARTE|nr:uncharacterized protein GSPATT00011910001 [Paramecium tetraurelia]CAK76337.1 unnamed protein product [Paramecium tetraurelia]|eukprot:XP_001443734.1 hypothetical protein (macronuclear) [Paramecium tetraurelia strain d4-2]